MTTHTRTLTVHDRLYQALLRLYPAEFRREYGSLMALAFRDLCRDARHNGGGFGLVGLWWRTLRDLVRSVITEHLAQRGVTMELEKIGQYEVKDQLGSGGMGDIYRVHDPESGQDRALKILKPGVDPGYRKYIRKQAKYLTELNHPALPTCYEFVEDGDQVYLVMDLIDGSDLLHILETSDEHLPVAEVVGWALGACDLLAYLHAQTPPLISRDVKPSNIMVDREGQVFLVEMGIIEEYHPGSELEKIGTEGYSPPEQYKGFSDPRSDIFALGATLHHLLTRRDPRKFEPFTFAEAPPCELNPAISEALAAVIMKAVEQEPDDRYQTVVELKAALQAAI
ncbi:MAG: serine/threonine protein kinase [Chloroflexi bacterium]|nr:serine/threonine protein kinase [Chloroflexota bacterium]